MKTKRFLAWILSLAMTTVILSSLSVSAADTITPTKPSIDASGVYQIGTAAELYWFAGLVNGTLTDGTAQNLSANAKLTADITVNSSVLNSDGSVKSGDFIEWTPIGNKTTYYKGNFDGNGKTIGSLNTAKSVTNCYNTGTVTVTGGITTGKIGSFAGSVYNYKGEYPITIENCFDSNLDTDSLPIYGSNNTNDPEPIVKSPSAFASGEVCYLLNGSSSADTVVWKQTLSTDATPIFDGLTVYYDAAKEPQYYNIVPAPEITLTTSNVTIENLYESATLIVASYDDEKLINMKAVPVSTGGTTTIASTGLTTTNADTLKAFLWKNVSGMVPLCESKSVGYNTGEFDAEWVTL